MTQLIKKLFGKKPKKNEQLEKPIVLSSANSEKPSSIARISLTKFIEANSANVKMNPKDVRRWFVREGLLVEFINDFDKDNTYAATPKGKKFGLGVSKYYYNGTPRSGIFLSEEAQKATINHFSQPVVNEKWQDLKSDTKIPVFSKQDLKIDDPYFDTILHDIDKNIKLDSEQRTAVISNKDNVLIVAGAGAGKTTTMAAKVKYLVEKQGVKPEEIIVISYTNKAINELRERINRKLKIPVNIATFHAFAFDIVKKKRIQHLRYCIHLIATSVSIWKRSYLMIPNF